MARFEGECSGLVLGGVLRGFESSPLLVTRTLGRHRLDRIDPDAWYSLDVTRAIYADLRDQTGARALYLAGLRAIEKGSNTPLGADLRAVLPFMDERYRLHHRGPSIGGVDSSFDDDHGAVVTFSTPLPCALSRGILAGYCARCKTPALLEHGAGGCIDSGADACVYRVSW